MSETKPLLRRMADAYDDVAAAIERLPPELALQVLSTAASVVRRESGALPPQTPANDERPAPLLMRVERAEAEPRPTAEELGEALVTEGGVALGPAVRAGAQALEELPTAGWEVLRRRARAIVGHRPHRPAGRVSALHAGSSEVLGLADYLRRKGPQQLSDLTAWSGVSQTTMSRRLRAALASGRIRKVGTAPPRYEAAEPEQLGVSAPPLAAEARHG